MGSFNLFQLFGKVAPLSLALEAMIRLHIRDITSIGYLARDWEGRLQLDGLAPYGFIEIDDDFIFNLSFITNRCRDARYLELVRQFAVLFLE